MTQNLLTTTMQLVFDTLPASILAIDTNYRVMIFNKSLEKLTGLSKEDMLNKDVTDVIENFIELHHAKPFLVKALENKDYFTNVKTSVPLPGGTLDLLATICPVIATDGRVLLALGTYRDINAITTHEKKILSLEKLAAMGQLAAGAAHEIRNPLTAIKGFMQLLYKMAIPEKSKKAQEYYQLINDEITNIDQLLSDFLLFSRAQKQLCIPVDINTLLKDIILLLSGEGLLLQITIDHNLKSTPLFILGNPYKIKEVFINLCRNAFQAMRPGGTLTISLHQDARQVHINITDTGCGLSSTTAKHIFEAYFTTKTTGTGLGLFICKNIIQEHKGAIRVDSALNKGSTFTVSLPLIEG